MKGTIAVRGSLLCGERLTLLTVQKLAALPFEVAADVMRRGRETPGIELR